MKKIILILFLGFIAAISLQAQEEFAIEIEEIAINGVPGVHSFSWGKSSNGLWVIFGGRIDGLHQRRPFDSFAPAGNNTNVIVIDIENEKTWSKPLTGLPAPIFEQLQATNHQFYQVGQYLYINGGYGYSPTAQDHITYPYLTAVDLDGVASAVIEGKDMAPFFRQIVDSNMAVTGGQMGYLNGTFYLCGGQYFKGRYNPMGPGHGTGFVQIYTDAVRKFKVNDDGTDLSLYDYSEIKDTNNMHRRDYNMSPQIFPDGSHGFTMFAGVFQRLQDLPFLNTVDVFENSYRVNDDFLQYLSHYHSAKVPIYDSENKTMHTVFFGGMSQYQIDANGNLIKDDNVPFVKTISIVTRFKDGSMTERKLNIEMPRLVGSGAEFIHVDNVKFINNDILDLNDLPEGKTLIGYIYGGIESTAPNIFFVNDGTQSFASDKIFKVYVNKSVTGVDQTELTDDNIFNLRLYPNPVKNQLTAEFFVPNTQSHTIAIYNLKGEKMFETAIDKQISKQTLTLDIDRYPAGEYIIVISDGKHSTSKRIIKR